MEGSEMRALVDAERVARLATARPDGAPHVVPIVYALDGETLLTPVDHKAKRTRDLQRIRNIRGDPRAAVLVDRYADDWTTLWWVRLDGRARLVDDTTRAQDLLAGRYPQYRTRPIEAPVIAIDIERWTGWRATRR